ncbi:oligoendopeptidase F [Clostridium sp. YIM B02551]|uniref:oligoendopeptidase F n=1 Tax=Clostridium sp. YIM B02551 TaxID=2910679 RepID=UPI001EE9B01F|nr:oligoendopeptidase F [Clostridium sp. YIM B02551]
MSEDKKLKNRNEIDESYKWDISKVYSSEDVWDKEFQELKAEAPKLKEYSGQLKTGEKILEYMKLSEKTSRKAEKLMIYAHLRSDEDTANSKFQVLKDKIDAYLAELGSYSAFFVPEILELTEEFLINEIDRIPELKIYEFLFKDILKEKPHVLTKEMEELMASVSDCLDAPSNIHNLLTNADMTFGTTNDDEGNDVELNEGNYSTFVRSKNRSVRENAFKKLYGGYKALENTLAASLSASIKNDIFSAKTRKYSSALEQALKPNDIPLDVYKNSVKTINENLSLLHRYIKLKKKLLKLDEMHMYDLYVPAIDVPKEHIEYEKGIEIIKKALNPLGEEYLGIFQEGIDNGWVDVYQNKGKRSGAYSWGSYDTMPYVLLNYNFQQHDVSTLAHEMGHSIHSYYSRKFQPYFYAGYTIFCAEVASTTNEALLIHYLIENENDKNKKLYLINEELEQIRTTVFRQLMFAEFELLTHESLENGEPLSAEALNSIWLDLNKKYHGEHMIVDQEIESEWSRIPHFYNDFYVYQYATGYAAASSFANSILKGEKDAVEKYKGFLKSGGSDYPINILKNAGVDMTSSKPLEATLERFNELLDMLEKEIK